MSIPKGEVLKNIQWCAMPNKKRPYIKPITKAGLKIDNLRSAANKHIDKLSQQANFKKILRSGAICIVREGEHIGGV